MKPRLSFPGLAWRSVRFYWRTELSVLTGSIIAAAVLVGALLVGDSVRYSLHRFALLRLGKTVLAVDARNRFFLDELGTALAAELEVPVASVIRAEGIAVTDIDDERRQLNRVQVLGVDSGFWGLDEGGDVVLDGESAALSSKSALALGASVGDRVSIRVGKPTLMPRDAPLASRNERLVEGGSFRVAAIVSDEQLGRFSLNANQLAPHNVFVSRAWLQSRLDLAGRSNLLLVGGDGADGPSAGEAEAAVKEVWHLGHVGIGVKEYADPGLLQLESDRIFLDPEVARAGLAYSHQGVSGVGVLTYMVNEIASGSGDGASIPYSFAVACSPSTNQAISSVPAGMLDDEVIVNRWVAGELGIAVGDPLSVTYYELGPGGRFVERTNAFTVRAVLEMERFRTERLLMPEFPGLTDVETCREWNIGMPMREDKLRDARNEAYWNEYGATPKLIFSLAAGRRMWANRFGDTTAIRFAGPAGNAVNLERALEGAMDPAKVGIFFIPVRESALAAVAQSLDLGEYFAYMSFFLIVAALMLTGLLFVFGVQQRAAEMGTLMAVGLRAWHVRFLAVSEGAVLALAGSVIGAALGTFYTRALVYGLGVYWQGAIAGAAIRYHAEPMTILVGSVSSSCFAIFAMGVAVWRQAKHPARVLMTGESVNSHARLSRPSHAMSLSAAGLCVAAAISTIAYATIADLTELAGPFFGAGSLLLVAGILLSSTLLSCLGARQTQLTLPGIGMRNAARRKGRSLTAVGLLACGCFMVLSVSAFKRDITSGAHERWSGSGGFELFAESTVAIPDPLETDVGAADFRLTRSEELRGCQFISLKVHDGDDASCFNLNRAQSPRMLGVDPDALAELRAFDMQGVATSVWELLKMPMEDRVIPALAGDGSTLHYGLHKRADPLTGETLSYKDELGNVFEIKLVGNLPAGLSVFQGSVLVSAANFMQMYPSEGGYRVFLVDVPAGAGIAAAQQALGEKMARVGLEVTTCVDRMAEFYSVESTYLAMFLVLGGLGLVLGTVGMGVVVLRNVLERRSELALLRCVGFTKQKIARIVMAEHWMLLALGMAVGIVASVVAVWPNFRAPGVEVPVIEIGVILLGVAAFGVAWITGAARLALRGELLKTLRSE